MADLKSTGWVKYASSDITVDQSAPTKISASAPTNNFDVHSFRSARIRFYADADDVTITPHIYLVYNSTNAPPAKPTGGSTVQFHSELLIDVAQSTAGTVTGVAGANALAGDNYFGTLGALTVSAWGTKVMAHVNGVIDVHIADNDIGEVLISDLANASGLHIRFELGTAVSANAEILLDV